jgi:hypothetical protein
MRFRDLDFRPMWILPLALLAGVLTAGQCRAATAPGDAREATIVMEADNPLYSFVRQFRERHGISVTYEEPAVAPGVGGRAAAASGGGTGEAGAALSVRYQVSTASGKPEDPAGAIREALATHQAAGGAVRFEVVEDGTAYHVIPVEMRAAGGRWVKVAPLLDTPLELARESRFVDNTVLEILAKLERATGQKVVWGYAPTNWVARTSVELGGDRPETARQLLAGALAGGRWTWELLYDQRLKVYSLGVHALGTPRPGSGR